MTLSDRGTRFAAAGRFESKRNDVCTTVLENTIDYYYNMKNNATD